MKMPDFIAGLLTAVFLLAGRWSISRFYSVPAEYEQFIWLSTLSTMGLFFLTLLFAPRGSEPLTNKARFWRKLWLLSLFLPLFYLLLSILWSFENLSWETKAGEVLLISVACFCVYRWRGSITYRNTILWTIFGLGGLLALMGVVFGGSGGGRMSVLAGGPNVLGRIMGALFIVSIFLFYSSRKSNFWLKVIYITIGLLGLLVLFLTGSRGSLLATAIAAILYVKISGVKIRYVIPIITVTFIAVLAVSFTPLLDKAQDMFMKRVVKLTLQQKYTSGRGEIAERAIDVGISSPIIGTGLRGFNSSLLGGGAYPHNFYLEFFSEGGAIGLGLISINTFLVLIVFLKYRNKQTSIFGALWILYLIAAQVSGDHFDNRNIFLMQILALTQCSPLFIPARQRNHASIAMHIPQRITMPHGR